MTHKVDVDLMVASVTRDDVKFLQVQVHNLQIAINANFSQSSLLLLIFSNQALICYMTLILTNKIMSI